MKSLFACFEIKFEKNDPKVSFAEKTLLYIPKAIFSQKCVYYFFIFLQAKVIDGC